MRPFGGAGAGSCGDCPTGIVERFNGWIEEVPQGRHVRSGEELETTLYRSVWLFNQQLPQSALDSKSPLQAMKEWHNFKPELLPELLVKQPYHLPGCDSRPPEPGPAAPRQGRLSRHGRQGAEQARHCRARHRKGPVSFPGLHGGAVCSWRGGRREPCQTNPASGKPVAYPCGSFCPAWGRGQVLCGQKARFSGNPQSRSRTGAQPLPLPSPPGCRDRLPGGPKGARSAA